MPDTPLEDLTDEQLQEEAYRAELRANLARNEIQRPGAARDRVLDTIGRITVEPEVDLYELKRALTTGVGVTGAFATAAEAFAKVAGHKMLAATLREWATTVPLNPDPAGDLFGDIKWNTAKERADHVARLREQARASDDRASRIRQELDRREQDRREQEIEERARGIRERSTT